MFWKMTPEVSTTDIDFLILQEALELPLARRRTQKIAKGRSEDVQPVPWLSEPRDWLVILVSQTRSPGPREVILPLFPCPLSPGEGVEGL